MNKKFLLAAALATVLIPAQAQTIAGWTFETAPPADLNNSTTGPIVAADVGAGTATGVQGLFHLQEGDKGTTGRR